MTAPAREITEARRAQRAAAGRLWKALNGEYERARGSERNARERALAQGVVVEHVPVRTYVALRRARCVYCGTRPANGVDHRLPFVHGGGHVVDNLQPCCRECNALKQRQRPEHFALDRCERGHPRTRRRGSCRACRRRTNALSRRRVKWPLDLCPPPGWWYSIAGLMPPEGAP